ncbi:hypothetical protein CRG98_006676 [Punica granatum]|uniref:Uncharacterized protein n=1 Tax=Punica granatum TaxID=22663 RepID=A0A2I0KYQ6_PUNGR|nr:hypothetical protein CRG98_006676 [Punica granatum]
MTSGDSFSRVFDTCPHGKVNTPKPCDNASMWAPTKRNSGPHIGNLSVGGFEVGVLDFDLMGRLSVSYNERALFAFYENVSHKRLGNFGKI